jgi:hypothetical protein
MDHNDQTEVRTDSQHYDSEVLNNTGAKLRQFLYELAEGTRDYRSLHNLTEQVEHQFRCGRPKTPTPCSL